MASRKSRRGFLGVVGAGTASALVAASGAAADAHKDAKTDKKTYSGVSKQGQLQDALEEALKAAVKDAPAGDTLVTWTLKALSGRCNSPAAVNELTVSIEASFG